MLSLFLISNSRPQLFTLLFCSLLWVFSAQTVQADAYRVEIYPHSAKVWEQSTLPIQKEEREAFVEVTLPFSADPNSLMMKSEDREVQIVHTRWREESLTPSKEIEKLAKRLETLEKEQRRVDAQIHALNARLQFWNSHSRFQVKDYSQIESLAETLSKEIEKSQRALHDQKVEEKKLADQINEVKKQLQQIAVSTEKKRVVTLRLSGVTPQTEVLKLNFSYLLAGSGWSSYYRLEALPSSEEVRFRWESVVWQRSGSDWNDVELSIATLPPQTALTPPFLPDWRVNVQPVKPALAEGVYAKRLAASAPVANEIVADAHFAMSPTLESRGSFSIWHLGRHSLKSGEETRLTVEEDLWNARFRHLSRPSQTPSLFLEAEVEFKKSKDFPVGEALVLIHGALLGKQRFSLSDDKATLYFGEDAFVTAESKTVERTTGKRGLLGGQKTLKLSLLTQFRNTHAYPVTIRVEEPSPQIGNEQIQLTTHFSPQPEKEVAGEAVYRWELSVPPKGERSITLDYEFKAPKEMEVDWGWR
jgi:uncharacterized protein (TIGR02231 family)